MKSLIRNILLGVLTFLSFLGFTKALELEKDFSVGTTMYIGEGYEDINCPNNLTYFDVTKVNDIYKVSLKSGIQNLPSSFTEKLTCEYLDNTDGSNVKSKKANVTFDLSYKLADREDTFTFTLTKTNFNATPGRDLNTPGNLNDIAKIISFDIISGGEYVDVSCPAGESSCIIALKKDFYTDSEKEFKATLVYTDVNGAKVTSHLIGKLKGKGTLEMIPGSYGKCSFGSEWSNEDGKYVLDYKGGNIVLPSCTSDGTADKAYEFYGWTSSTLFDTASDVCASSDIYHAGESFNPDEKGIYRLYSCYVARTGVIIHTNGAELNVDNNWLALGKDSYYIFGEEQVVLPEVNKVPAIYGEGAKFLGWQLNGTSTIVPAGTTVEANRKSYHAIFETVSYFDSSNDYEFNYMYEGDTQVYSINNVTFDGCSSMNTSFVKAEFTNGKCNITALKVTDDIVEVKATSSSTTYTLKLKVLSKGSSSSSSSQYTEPFVVSFDYLVAGDQHDGTTSGATTPTETTEPKDGEEIQKSKTSDVTLTSKDVFCTKYYVNKTTPLADGETRYFAVSTLSGAAGFKMGMPKFIAKETCASKKTYDTICLDPSGTAPKSGDEGATADGIPYYKVDFPTEDFERAASVITGELIKRKYQSNQDELLAANMALRIIAYDLGLSNVYNQEQLGTSYVINHLLYSNFAKAMRKELNEKKDITLNDSKYGYPAKWNEENTRQLVVKYLKLFYLDNSKSKDNSIKDFSFELEDATFVETAKGEGTFSGKLKVPSDMSDIRPSIVATPEFVSGDISYVDGSISFKEDGTFSFSVKYKNSSVLAKKGAIKFKLTFTTDSGRLKVALLKPDDKFKKAHYQRMIIFDDDNSDSSVYLEFTATGGSGEDEDEDEPNVCDLSLTELLNNEEKLKEFKEKDCCQFITDQQSEVYQKLCLDGNTCLKNTFALACDPGNTKEKDIYTVSEGYVKNGDDYVEKYDVCIVDVRVGEAARKHTDQITDAVGNKISLDDYSNNKYCRVSCKEDWDFSFSGFKNFTGERAIKAGSYFEVDDGIFIGGARTCVTTYIDVNGYVNEVEKLSNTMVKSYNDYALYSTVRNVLKESAVVSNFGIYYSYDYDPSEVQYACPTTGSGNITINGINYNVGDSSCTTGKIEVVRVKNKKQYDGVIVSVDSSSNKVSADTRKYNQYGNNAGNYSFNPNPKYTYVNACEKIDISNGSWYSKEAIDKINSNCFDKTESLENIINNFVYNGKKIGETIDASKKNARESKADLESSAKDMAACQNFYLNNNTKVENNSFNVGETELTKKEAYESGYAYKIVDSGKLSNQSLKVGYQLIDTKFAPFARFQYEEVEFMAVIGEENYLVTFDEKNKQMGLSKEDNNKCIDIDLDDSKDKEVKTSLCKNKIDTYSYKSNGNEDVYSNSNAASSNSGNVADSVKNKSFVLCQIGDNDYSVDYKNGQTDCANALLYYYDVNYIKQSLKNSSYYKNYGTWYVQSGTDTKTYEPSMDEAISKFGGDKYNWSMLSYYNTFPIAITTRRNVYRYMYSFDNIGYFANNKSRVMTGNNKDAISDLGRIMGATNSIMLNNVHTCFYEVYEDICKCCGDPIDTALLDAGNYRVVTEQHLSGYCTGNNCSKSDPNTRGNNASLNIYPSTVSLYDLDSLWGDDASSYLGKNWSATSSFYVSGETHTTDKGAKLANQIQSLGENIYDDTPEYSFYFEPEALSKIKEYNRGKTYTVNTDDLIPYGYYKVVSEDGKNFDVEDENSQVTMIHYGSKFLEGLIGYVPTDYYNKTFISRKSNNVCYVVSTDADAAKNAYKITKGSDCRWVDYIQYDEKTSNYYRLAYK